MHTGDLPIPEVSSFMNPCARRCFCWDGSSVLCGGQSGDLLLWDLLSNTISQRIPAHSGTAQSAAASGQALMNGVSMQVL